jgi:hypothetical protein
VVAKAKREKGEAYVSTSTKKEVPAKAVRIKTCGSQNCPYKCSNVFQEEDRLNIHRSFWDLSHQRRQDFYTTNIKRFGPERSKHVKKNSYMYLLDLNGVAHRVCKEFFCNTLDVSPSSVTYHLRRLRNPGSNLTRPLRQGRHRKRYVSEARLNEVRNHIDSFPCEPSHYCRSDSTRMYLRRDVRNIKQMYNWYVQSTNDPVKLHTYSKVFNKERNIAFFTPKKDVCNKCSAYMMLQPKTDEARELQVYHVQRKLKAREEKQADLEKAASDPSFAVLSFDMENVFNLPQGNTSVMFYKRKWRTFNLTAKTSCSKKVYNAIWHEGVSGRLAEDISSALIKILVAFVTDNPSVKHLILWSDSCVSQNRNSIMSATLINFLCQPTSLKLSTITQKYCEAGHSAITEVDSAHSVISRVTKAVPIGSHPGLLKIIEGIPKTKKHDFVVLEMQSEDFKDFKMFALQFDFSSKFYILNLHFKYN